MNSEKSSTLIELLVAIPILLVLAVAAIFLINPPELFKQTRDSQRISDMANLNAIIGLVKNTAGDQALGTPNILYISLPDTNSSCQNLINSGLQTPPPGWTYHCVTSDNLIKSDGSGWIPVNFSSVKGQESFNLPLDPLNTTSTNYYTYSSKNGSWEVTATFESQKYLDKEIKDGGADPVKYEAGTDLTISPFASGMIGYWPFDEGSGLTTVNISLYGGNATLMNNPDWATGKINQALNFTGSKSTYVNTGSFVIGSNNFSVSGWIYPTSASDSDIVFQDVGASGGQQWKIRYSYNGKISFYTNVTGWKYGNTSLTPNQWIFFTVVGDGVNTKIYVNGTLDGTFGAGYNIALNNSPLRIGDAAGVSTYFTGIIDEFRVYRYALSANQVQALYNGSL